MKFIFLTFTGLMGLLFLSNIPQAIKEFNQGVSPAMIIVSLSPTAILFVGGFIATKKSFARSSKETDTKK